MRSVCFLDGGGSDPSSPGTAMSNKDKTAQFAPSKNAGFSERALTSRSALALSSQRARQEDIEPSKQWPVCRDKDSRKCNARLGPSLRVASSASKISSSAQSRQGTSFFGRSARMERLIRYFRDPLKGEAAFHHRGVIVDLTVAGRAHVAQARLHQSHPRRILTNHDGPFSDHALYAVT